MLVRVCRKAKQQSILRRQNSHSVPTGLGNGHGKGRAGPEQHRQSGELRCEGDGSNMCVSGSPAKAELFPENYFNREIKIALP